LLQPLQECPDAGLRFRIVRGKVREYANASLRLLRVRRERPSRRAQRLAALRDSDPVDVRAAAMSLEDDLPVIETWRKCRNLKGGWPRRSPSARET
jgi:hypothetical protein